MCKPPEWCKIEALHRRLYIWPEKIARRKKKPGGKKSANGRVKIFSHFSLQALA